MSMSLPEVGVPVIQNNQKKTGGCGKAIASAFLPGLGQYCDGRNKEGTAYLLSTVGTGALAGYLNYSAGKDVLMAHRILETGAKKLSGLTKLKGYSAIVLALTTLGLWCANVIDAYKGNKKQA